MSGARKGVQSSRPRRGGVAVYSTLIASAAIDTVNAIIVTLKTNATRLCAVTVRRMVRDVTSTSETADEVPMVKAK